MFAVWNFRLTKLLVEVGANVNMIDIVQESPLHMASRRSNSDVVELLLEHGADLDTANDSGWKPLQSACFHINPVVVDSLLRHNADIDILNNDGETALQIALSRPPASPNRVAVLQLMATCAPQMRLEASSADWIRLAQNERSRPQMALGFLDTARQRRRRQH